MDSSPWNRIAERGRALAAMGPVQVAAGAVTLASGGLLFLPGFGILNYFFCTATAIILSLVTGPLAIFLVRGARNRGEQTTGIADAITASLLLCIIPLVVVAFGALRATNCDVVGGLGVYLMSAVFSACFAAIVGLAWGLATPRAWMGVLCYSATVLGSFAAGLYVLYTEPAIFLYNPFFGYFSGAIYDDVIRLTGTYGLYRLHNVVHAALILFLIWKLISRDTMRLTFSRFREFRWPSWGMLVVLLAGIVFFHAMDGELGYGVDRKAIQETLGGSHETEHFSFYYDQSNKRLKREIHWIAEDHEFRYHQLTKEFGKPFPEKIQVYIYGNAAQKRELMGAGKVYVAKPWLHEVHLGPVKYGQAVIKHEMAHVFAGMFAPGPLRVTTQSFFLPHMGLIEGLAASVEGSSRRLTAHQWSAALLALKKLPNLPTIMGAEGYLNTYGPTAYTAAGSFIRYLADTYSMEQVLSVYGNADFDAAFNKSLSALIDEWKAFLADRSQVPLGDDELARAEHLFDHPPVLQRVCPLVIAGLLGEAGTHLSKKEYPEAIALYEEALSFRDNAPRLRALLLNALIKGDRLDTAIETADAILNDQRTGSLLSARVSERIADVAWKEGRFKDAESGYGALLSAPLSVGEIRRIALKREWVAWEDSATRELGRKVLFGEGTANGKKHPMEELLEKGKEDPTIQYMMGRRLLLRGKYKEATTHLLDALNRGTFHPLILSEAHRSAAMASYFTDEVDRAQRLFGEAEKLLPADAHGLRDQLRDWIDRCRWKKPQLELSRTTQTQGPIAWDPFTPTWSEPVALRAHGGSTSGCGDL